MRGSDFTDSSLAELRSLPLLRYVTIRDAPRVTDACIARMRECEALAIVSFEGTGVTREGADELQRALPNCKVDWSPGRPRPAVSEWLDARVDSPTVGQVFVSMRGATIVDETVAATAGRVNLRHLVITEAPNVTDRALASLRSARGLRYLLFHGTSATESGVSELRLALPDCNIEWLPAGPRRSWFNFRVEKDEIERRQSAVPSDHKVVPVAW